MIVNQHDIDALIGKDLSNEISAKEKAVLTSWFGSAEANRSYYAHFKTLFEKSADLKRQEFFDTDAAWIKVKQKIKSKHQPKIIPLNWRIAAALATLMIAGIFAYTKFLIPQDVTDFASTQQTTEKSLPDGTSVFLNKSTSVSYEYDPLKKIRKANLTGEAFFNIAEKEKQEFLLEVDGLLIKDIGTSFNVKAYPGRDTIEVYVERGEVIFYTPLDSGLHLKEKEIGYYVKSSATFSKLNQPNENLLAYRTQIFVFDNTRLSEVIEAVNEVYDVKLKLTTTELENCRITVAFRHETIDMIAEVIAETLSLTFEKTEHEITLNGKGCAK